MSSEVKRQWDSSAEDFQKVYEMGLGEYNLSLLEYWKEKGMLLPGMKVLDIGCGVGRYGTCFAALGCDVTLMDISSEMLKYAAENMSAYTVPWRVFEGDFSAMTGDEDIFSGGFDLTISTMSPAIRSAEDVERMTKITRGWCFLSNFCTWEQPFRSRMLLETGIETGESLSDYTERGGKQMIETVRSLGYEPVVDYVPYCWADERTPEEMAGYMVRRFFSLDEDREEKYRKMLEYSRACAGEKGTVSDEVKTTVAWISWKGTGK